MTICIAVAVFDGIVFAADSASSLLGKNAQGQPVITNVYRNGNKVFNLVKGLPLVAMTCGMGNFGRAPIATITKDLRKLLIAEDNDYSIDIQNYTLKEVSEKARNFFKAQYEGITPRPENPHTFQYWIGGFAPGSDLHEIWEFKIENGNVGDVSQSVPPGETGLLWGGQPEAVSRLVMGYSPAFVNALARAGLANDALQKLMNTINPLTQAQLVNPAMPIIDAIDLADFLTDTTKRFVRFLPGSDIVGGDIDIATVTRHERFKWIRRKHYYSSKINPLETDHV